MKNRTLLLVLLMFSTAVLNAQNNDNKMTEAQKEQAAKADAFIIDSNKKITNSFSFTAKDTATVIKDSAMASKKSKKKCLSKRNKKSS